MTRKIKTLERQCPLDIALQEYGSTEAVYQVMRDNPQVTRPDQYLPAGSILVISDITFNKEVRDKFATTNKKIVSMSNTEHLLFGDFNDDFNIDFF